MAAAAKSGAAPMPGTIATTSLLHAGGGPLPSPSTSSSAAAAPDGALGPALRAVAACLAWSAASSGIIFLNKYIMDKDGFRFPMALSCLGMTCSSVCSYVAVVHLRVVPRTIEIDAVFWLTRALPIGACGALTLYWGNLAYLYISVPFIQMLKGMTPIITLAVGVAFGIDAFTAPLCASLAVIGIGVAVSSYGETQFVLAGFVAMIGAETAEAGKVVLMQKLMAGSRLHVLEGLLCFAPPCALALALGVVALEWDGMVAVGFGKMAARPGLYAAQGAMGFVVNLLILQVIKATSSVTFKVVSMMKNVAVVLGAVPLFGDSLTGLQAFGYAVSLGGFALYQRARSTQPPVGKGKLLADGSRTGVYETQRLADGSDDEDDDEGGSARAV